MAEQTPANNGDRICKECGMPKKIVGRGICGACYHRLKVAGNLDKYPASRKPKKKEKLVEASATSGKELKNLKGAMSRVFTADVEFDALRNLIIALKPLDADGREKVIDTACDILTLFKK